MVFNRLVAGLNFCTEVVFRRGLVENEELYVLKISFGKNDSTALQQPLIIPHWRIKTLSLSGVLQCIVASCSSITLPSSFLLWLSGILRSVKLLYYQLLMSTYRCSNILRSESSGALDL